MFLSYFGLLLVLSSFFILPVFIQKKKKNIQWGIMMRYPSCHTHQDYSLIPPSGFMQCSYLWISFCCKNMLLFSCHVCLVFREMTFYCYYEKLSTARDMCFNQTNDLGELVDSSLLSSSNPSKRVPYLPSTVYSKVMSFTTYSSIYIST